VDRCPAPIEVMTLVSTLSEPVNEQLCLEQVILNDSDMHRGFDTVAFRCTCGWQGF